MAVRADAHRAIQIGPEDFGTRCLEALDGPLTGMTVVVVAADADSRDTWSQGVHEALGRRRAAAVVGNLQEVEARAALRDAGSEQPRIDVILDVTREQEAALPEPQIEDERGIVDGASTARRALRQRPCRWPEDMDGGAVKPDLVALREDCRVVPATLQLTAIRGIAGTVAVHPVLRDSGDGIPLEQQRQTSHVILVRVGQDDQIETPVPRRKARVERGQKLVRIRASVDQQPPAARPLEQQRIALADIQDRDPEASVGP